MTETTILATQELSKSFGGVHAVRGVSLAIPKGMLYALIGPNGAGKSTFVNLLTGALKPSTGTVKLADKAITGLRPHRIVAAGMARTFQNGRLFRRLSVLDNVLVGATQRVQANFFDVVLRTPRFRRDEFSLRERSRAALDQIGLSSVASQDVSGLPYGQQRMVEIARALVSEPQVLLLDEPAAGLNSGEVEGFLRVLDRLRADGLTILLIEHNMGLVMRAADRIGVLNYGEKIAEGSPESVRRNPVVLEAYLGRGYSYA